MPVRLQGSTSGYSQIDAPAVAGDQTFTLPEAGGTFVTTTGTQTLTNKTIQGGALTLETAKASTSGTVVDFTGIPSWVKRVTVMFNGVSTSGTSVPLIQIGGSGGIENTGYAAKASILTTTTITADYTTGFGVSQQHAAADTLQGLFQIALLNPTSNLWAANGTLAYTGRTGTCTFAGSKSLSGTLDRIRITTVNGTDTFDAGSINIMYEG